MREYLRKYISYLKYEKRYSEHTIVSYNNDILQFIEYIDSKYSSIRVYEINSAVIRSWMVSLLNNNEKNNTVNRKITSLRSFYKFLMKNEIVKSNPTSNIIRPKTPKRLPKSLRADKLIEFKKQFEEYIQSNDDSFSTFRDYTLFSILYATGMRRSELVNLKWGNIDFHNREITIYGKGKKMRKIPIANSLLETLREYREKIENESIIIEDNMVIVLDNGKKTYPNFIYRTIKKLLNKISQLKGIGPHTLRHSFATHILDEGAELNAIKDLLGHSSLAATQIYTSNSIEKLKKIHKSFHPKS